MNFRCYSGGAYMWLHCLFLKVQSTLSQLDQSFSLCCFSSLAAYHYSRFSLCLLSPPLSFHFLNHTEEVNILIVYECRNRQTKSTVTWELIDTIRRQPGIIRALLTPLMALDMCSIRIKSQVFALSVFESLDIVGFTVP